MPKGRTAGRDRGWYGQSRQTYSWSEEQRSRVVAGRSASTRLSQPTTSREGVSTSHFFRVFSFWRQLLRARGEDGWPPFPCSVKTVGGRQEGCRASYPMRHHPAVSKNVWHAACSQQEGRASQPRKLYAHALGRPVLGACVLAASQLSSVLVFAVLWPMGLQKGLHNRKAFTTKISAWRSRRGRPYPCPVCSLRQGSSKRGGGEEGQGEGIAQAKSGCNAPLRPSARANGGCTRTGLAPAPGPLRHTAGVAGSACTKMGLGACARWDQAGGQGVLCWRAGASPQKP